MKKSLVLLWMLVLGNIPLQAATVPFSNILLNPNQSISASYNFGQHKQIICYENSLSTVGLVTWPYQGVWYSTNLTAQLKTQSNISGNYADASGTLTVLNNQGFSLVVSCLFGF